VNSCQQSYFNFFHLRFPTVWCSNLLLLKEILKGREASQKNCGRNKLTAGIHKSWMNANKKILYMNEWMNEWMNVNGKIINMNALLYSFICLYFSNLCSLRIQNSGDWVLNFVLGSYNWNSISSCVRRFRYAERQPRTCCESPKRVVSVSKCMRSSCCDWLALACSGRVTALRVS
jgi:hypothetical protein